ncbi:MAG: hypothetical protein V1882_10575 [Candidatus Omnitrophota bacterium]
MKKHEKGVPAILRFPVQGRKLLPVTAGLVCLVALVHFVFWPLLARINNVRQKIEVREKILEELVNLTGNAEEIARQFPPYAQYVQGGLTQEEQEGLFMKGVETIAKSSGVVIVKQQPYVVKNGGDFLDIDLQIELEAQLRDILSFLYSIDHSDDLMHVLQMRLIPKPSTGAPLFRCQVDISKRYIK